MKVIIEEMIAIIINNSSILSTIRSIYVIKRYGPIANIHHVGSIGAPSRRTVFIRTSAEH
jgi:hypothetical protein